MGDGDELHALRRDAGRGWDPARKVDGLRITQAEQASFVIQAYALGIAAGYETLFWQAMQDDRPPVPDGLWGLVRFHPDPLNADPVRVRPAYTTYQVATRYLSDAERVELLTVDRADPAGFRVRAPRYQWWVHYVVFQKGTRRTGVLWNGSGAPTRVSLPRRGESARVVDKLGNETPLAPQGDRWVLTLDAATRRATAFGGDPPGYFLSASPPCCWWRRGCPRRPRWSGPASSEPVVHLGRLRGPQPRAARRV